MSELEALLKDIEKLRAILNEMIAKKNNLQDDDVLKASQELNEAITKYTKLIVDKAE